MNDPPYSSCLTHSNRAYPSVGTICRMCSGCVVCRLYGQTIVWSSVRTSYKLDCQFTSIL